MKGEEMTNQEETQMVRRTQQLYTHHLCADFGGLLRSACRSGCLGLVCLAMSGCGQPPGPVPPPHLTQSDRLSVHGDDLMIQGRKLRDQGLASGDKDMQYRGEAMIAQGRILINKASAMVDQPEPSGPVPGITHSPY